MESDIIVKATLEEMENFFDNSPDVCSVKYYRMNEDETFEVRIRHAELPRQLRGEFTIPGIMKRLKGKG